MGGYGSGNRWQSRKRTTNDLWQLDVRRIHRDGLLVSGQAFNWAWSHNGERMASIGITVHDYHVTLKYRSRHQGDEWEEKEYPVALEWTGCHFGGQRPWFLCPCCGRRVAVLFGGCVYACRHCHDLAYPSQREAAHNRLLNRMFKIRDRLDWKSDYGPKPKGMHWKTFERLVAEHRQFNTAAWKAAAKKLNLIPDD